MPIRRVVMSGMFTFSLACAGLVSGQQVSDRDASSGTPVSRTVALNSMRKQELNFVVLIEGSITGRIFDESEQADSQKTSLSRGISGVKVTLKSRDAGFERFMIEQFTDAYGMYDFQYLRPGKYTIEIDPLTLPSGYRGSEP
jgi:hypothetical protein